MDNDTKNLDNKFFNINEVLMTVFSSLVELRKEKSIELIYNIDATTPKELRGDPAALSQLLTKILIFIFQNADNKEVVLSLYAPSEFGYEESISFEIRETNLRKLMVESFLENRLKKDLEFLHGKIIYDENDPSAIHVSIPFKMKVLGNKRFYRLPDIAMLGKKVLFICSSQKMAQSIKKMFSYFLYDVDVKFDEFVQKDADLTQYDMLVVEDKLLNKDFEAMIHEIQQSTPLRYVIFGDSNVENPNNGTSKPVYLAKPVMQESIFELIKLLYWNNQEDKSAKPIEKKELPDLGKYIEEAFARAMQKVKEEKKETQEIQETQETQDDRFKNVDYEDKKYLDALVLDTQLGKKNAKNSDMNYRMELKKFLDIFGRSDIYFRNIVNENLTWKTKEFCIELKEKAVMIGAQKMLKFVDWIILLFVYDKVEELPKYTEKYHAELTKLMREIEEYIGA